MLSDHFFLAPWVIGPGFFGGELGRNMYQVSCCVVCLNGDTINSQNMDQHYICLCKDLKDSS